MSTEALSQPRIETTAGRLNTLSLQLSSKLGKSQLLKTSRRKFLKGASYGLTAPLLSMLAGCDRNWNPFSSWEAKESIWFDVYSEEDRGFTGPAVTSYRLMSGEKYLIEIYGTMSVWTPESWDNPCAGEPEGGPIFSSEMTVNGPVGIDAAYYFAWPVRWDSEGYTHLCPNGNPISEPPLPYKEQSDFPRGQSLEFSLDGGENWYRPIPRENSFNKEHRYTYLVTGKSNRLKIRFVDHPTHDNYGKLRITLYA